MYTIIVTVSVSMIVVQPFCVQSLNGTMVVDIVLVVTQVVSVWGSSHQAVVAGTGADGFAHREETSMVPGIKTDVDGRHWVVSQGIVAGSQAPQHVSFSQGQGDVHISSAVLVNEETDVMFAYGHCSALRMVESTKEKIISKSIADFMALDRVNLSDDVGIWALNINC